MTDNKPHENLDPIILDLANKLINKGVNWLKFRTYDIYSEGIPESILWTIQDIYDYCRDKNIGNPTILRLGNGHGKDLYIQNYILNNLEIKPNYFLLDYNSKLQIESAEHNPDIPTTNYITYDLFRPLNQNIILNNLTGKVDVIDCQEILHEIASVGLGGSIEHLKKLVEQFKTLLKIRGIVAICDVNIASNNQNTIIEFTATDKFSRLINLFNQKLPSSDIKSVGNNGFRSSIKCLAIFMGKYRFLNDNSLSNTREFLEIHKNLTIEGWKRIIRESNLGLVHFSFPRMPKVIEKEISGNIQIDLTNLPPFSVHVLATS